MQKNRRFLQLSNTFSKLYPYAESGHTKSGLMPDRIRPLDNTSLNNQPLILTARAHSLIRYESYISKGAPAPSAV
jgi:hypothetical protein